MGAAALSSGALTGDEEVRRETHPRLPHFPVCFNSSTCSWSLPRPLLLPLLLPLPQSQQRPWRVLVPRTTYHAPGQTLRYLIILILSTLDRLWGSALHREHGWPSPPRPQGSRALAVSACSWRMPIPGCTARLIIYRPMLYSTHCTVRYSAIPIPYFPYHAPPALSDLTDLSRLLDHKSTWAPGHLGTSASRGTDRHKHKHKNRGFLEFVVCV